MVSTYERRVYLECRHGKANVDGRGGEGRWRLRRGRRGERFGKGERERGEEDRGMEIGGKGCERKRREEGRYTVGVWG